MVPVLRVAQLSLAAVLDGTKSILPSTLGSVPRSARVVECSAPSSSAGTPLLDMVAGAPKGNSKLPGGPISLPAYDARELVALTDALQRDMRTPDKLVACSVLAATTAWSCASLGLPMSPTSLASLIDVLSSAMEDATAVSVLVGQAGSAANTQGKTAESKGANGKLSEGKEQRSALI